MNAPKLLSLLVAFLIAGCTTNQPFATAPVLTEDEGEAAHTLEAFFVALHEGRYAEAVPLYGGSFDTMQDHNPSLPADDLAALMRNACEINGAACLKPGTITFQEAFSPVESHFLVRFQNEDGSLFVRGPCCGASLTDQPPECDFPFIVIEAPDGTFLVTDMPPYVP